jgi:hypothetical protein
VNRVPRIEERLVVRDHGLALLLDRVLIARERVADGRSRCDIGHRRVDVRRAGQGNRVVTLVSRPHAQKLGDVPAARAAVDANLRRIAVPRRRLRFEPPHPVVRILNAGRVRRLRRQRQVDGDDEHAAGGDGAVHRFFGAAVFPVPRAAVKIQQGWERSGAFRPIDTRQQRPSGSSAAILDFADVELELRGWIVRRRSGPRQARVSGTIETWCPAGHHASRAEHAHLLEEDSPADRFVAHVWPPRNLVRSARQ